MDVYVYDASFPPFVWTNGIHIIHIVYSTQNSSRKTCMQKKPPKREGK